MSYPDDPKDGSDGGSPLPEGDIFAHPVLLPEPFLEPAARLDDSSSVVSLERVRDAQDIAQLRQRLSQLLVKGAIPQK